MKKKELGKGQDNVKNKYKENHTVCDFCDWQPGT